MEVYIIFNVYGTVLITILNNLHLEKLKNILLIDRY